MIIFLAALILFAPPLALFFFTLWMSDELDNPINYVFGLPMFLVALPPFIAMFTWILWGYNPLIVVFPHIAEI